MNAPTMFEPRQVAEDTHILPSFLPVPGFGVLPVNAFLIRAAQPVLVDTGMFPVRDAFLQSLKSLIDLNDIRWIYMTHMDADHIGSLQPILAEAPNARVVTTFVGMGKMNLNMFPLDRVYLLNPGQSLDVGDRQLTAMRPGIFDAPETTCVFDTKSRALFTADWFGALLQQPAEDAAAVPADQLRAGQIGWATIDAPWLQIVKDGDFHSGVAPVHQLEPSVVLSGHLPPASGMLGQMMGNIAAALQAPAFVGPDQAALEQMMSGG
jgi:hypothetical protein